MSFLGKFRPISYSGNPSAPATRPSYGPNHRFPPVPLHAPAGGSARPGEETTGRFSNGLKEFLWHLEGIGRGSLLDLGAVSQATLTYFIEHNFKVYTEDLMAGWGAFLEQDSQRIALLPPDAERPDLSPAARAGLFSSMPSSLCRSAQTISETLTSRKAASSAPLRRAQSKPSNADQSPPLRG